MFSEFQSFWHISINVAAYLYKCPPFSCSIQYSLSQFPCSAIDWYICTGVFNFLFLDGFSALVTRWPIVVKSCWADYKQLIWAITSCFLPLRVWIFFLLWLWFSPELIVLHLKLNLCVERWNCQHHWIDDQLFLNWSKTGYNQLTWTITFVFPVTII